MLFRTYHGLRVSLLLLFLIASGQLVTAGNIAAGYWVKLKVVKQGVYKINYSDLQAAGFPVSELDPRNLTLLGNQGGNLSEYNANRTPGLNEVPIWVSGESDGHFDASDYILFYGGITVKWSFNGTKWTHRVNDYENTAWMYLGVGSKPGLRVGLRNNGALTPKAFLNTTDYLITHDSDMVNPAEMGRTWLGEKLGNETLERNFSFTLPADAADSAYVTVAYAAGPQSDDGTVTSTINGVKTTKLYTLVDPEYKVFTDDRVGWWAKTPSKQVDITLKFGRSNAQSSAWVNYIDISTSRPLIVGSTPEIMRSSKLFNAPLTQVTAAGNNLRVWSVTNELRPVEYEVNQSGNTATFLADSNLANPAYVVFNDAGCYRPEFGGRVNNADILAGEAVEFIIITHPDFADASNALAEFRRNNDGYKVKVVTPAAIYNEYNAGMQDIVAIRDYIRDEYNKSLHAGTTLKYLLLMGAASYDMKDRMTNNSNKIAVYEDYSSEKSGTFCLDDFYAYLDSGMGRPVYDNNIMKLSVGRITARTAAEANGVVEKLKRYASIKSLGPWRTNITFITDDVDKPFEEQFEDESETYCNNISNTHPDIQINKIYSDAYKQISNGNTEMYPEVMDAIDKTVNDGNLFVNYQGHGGEKGWAQEGILTIPRILAWNNKYNMPVFFTATCEFSRYDNPKEQSGGELSLLNPNGGPIALMTTTRMVYVNGNAAINYDFWTNYGFPKPNQDIPTVGDLYQIMKNRPGTTTEDNKFSLLGDPSMRLAFPKHKIVLDSINGKYAAGGFDDTIKAFSVVRIKGHVEQRQGGKFNTFNGKLWVKVLDKPQVRHTLDNNNQGSNFSFKDQTNVIYRGTVTVENGDFQIVFSIPKDIDYSVAYGKIMLYAHNGETDASGARQLLIGGSETNIAADDQGPSVRVFMNDTSFINGSVVDPDAMFLALVKDPSGINATGSGIGRDMIAVLDKGSSGEKTFIVNDYFTYDLNSYTSGRVEYMLNGLSVGKHSIFFKVWDIHNNSAEATVEFEVQPANSLKIKNNYVYPNPFNEGDGVHFMFEHNKAGEPLHAALTVYDMVGNKVYSQETDLENTLSRETRITWTGRSPEGAELPHGYYVYLIRLTAQDGSTATVRGKVMKN